MVLSFPVREIAMFLQLFRADVSIVGKFVDLDFADSIEHGVELASMFVAVGVVIGAHVERGHGFVPSAAWILPESVDGLQEGPHGGLRGA